ncbi:P-loop containing nucleoside triphosphate hydrolase protein [Xylariaceae sp. FL1272]|nr:P-loop containing nucleoside triphosphate hydrolase protein [Xylariaceae sp. FL1272]
MTTEKDVSDKAGELADPEKSGETKTLISEIRCLSWPEWRKLRLSEYEVEKAKKKASDETATPAPEQKEYVIDAVYDTGDMGPPAYQNTSLSSKRSRMFGRVRINSQHVISFLGDTTNVYLPQRCQLLHPFKILVDNFDKIQSQMKMLEDKLDKAKAAEVHGLDPVLREQSAHFKCLVTLLDTHLALEVGVAQAVKDRSLQKIMFCHLWHLFPPGETIFYQKVDRDEPPQASKVLKVSGGRARLPNSSRWLETWTQSLKNYNGYTFQKVSPFTIDAFHLDYDGTKYRLVQVTYEIPKYPGECSITSLPVFPMRFLQSPENERIRSLLLNRGYNFRDLATDKAAHREYHAASLDLEPEEIDGRVIVDFKQNTLMDNKRQKYYRENNNEEDKGRVFGLRPLSQTSASEVSEVIGIDEVPDAALWDDHNYDIDLTERLFSNDKVLLAPSHALKPSELKDEELLLLPGTVYAYVLRSRNYCRCDISHIKEVVVNKKAFDNLVLSDERKDLLRSLVDSHSRGSRDHQHESNANRPAVKRTESVKSSKDASFGDMLNVGKKKGKGLIILLHGVPGVGKTSTAETVAEATGRPLLPVTSGDLGEKASDMEKNLEHIFTQSHRWGCVLLLDEAEVFLERRGLQNLTRNAMVSIFLRALEFYSGILFLTTNRVGSIDEAFKSRIDLSLYYEPLDWETSKQIWQINLRDCQNSGVEVNEKEVLRFAEKQFQKSAGDGQWNGRQISNAFKIAKALAEFDTLDEDKRRKDRTAVLTKSHLKKVARVAQEFDKYLLDVRAGQTQAKYNKQYHLRADDFGLKEREPPKGRLTRTRTVDRTINEMPSSSEDDLHDSDSNSSGSESSSSSEPVKKSQKKGKSSKAPKGDKKKSHSSKSKKTSKSRAKDDSDESP